MKKGLEQKIYYGERIDDGECLSLFDLELGVLGELATAVKKRFHPGDTATFIVDININLSNVCECGCKFCAFHVEPGSAEAFVLSADEVCRKVESLLAIGGTQVMLQGGVNKELGLEYYAGIISRIKSRYGITVHALSPAEISGLSRRENKSIREILEILRSAGLDSLPGGGAEILVEHIRRELSPGKISAAEWLEIMRIAHSIGMKSTATMMFGGIESVADRVSHLAAIRNLQDETGGFRAFIPWTFCPGNTSLDHIKPAGGGEYLKLLAISRIYLDNIIHIGSGWLTEGMRVAQLGLFFGADDMGGVLLEEKVLSATGIFNCTGIDDMRRNISGAALFPRNGTPSTG